MIGVSGRILSTAEIIAMKRCGIVSEVSGEGTLRMTTTCNGCV